MAQDKANFELREPANPEGLLPRNDDALLAWLAMGALATLVILIAWRAWWRRHRVSSNQHARRNQALKDAASALGRIATSDARAAAVQTSLVLRRYLAIAANDPALFETHEEFIARSDALQALTESARAACAAGFATLAACKYAPVVPSMEAAAVIAGGRDLLETLHRGFQG